MPTIGLVAGFLLTAALYASVGFGGGSTYIALLALAEIDYRLLPIIALLCNIIVVVGGTLRFHSRGLIDWSRVWPIVLLSVPAAWIGGLIAIEKDLFLLLLALSLLLAALLLLLEPLMTERDRIVPGLNSNKWFPPLIGTGIGFLSGMVGIGGGIFLAPILLLTNWADSRRIAATASLFILVNSIAGLVGQLMKSGVDPGGEALFEYWPLFIGVLAGGQIGSVLASRKLPDIWIRRLTAALIFYVSIRILWQQIA